MNNTYENIDQLLDWFREEPRTKRWDAMLAFDQATTNTLLLQQYIERFNSDSYLEPVNGTIDLGSGRVAEIHNYVFDKPRLSFENADLDAPTATLRIQGLGGMRFDWDTSGATRQLKSIAYESPINGDVHQSIVTLRDKSVSVREHQVIIDTASGREPLLKFGATLNEKKKAGAWIKRAFELKPPEVREYVLSELKGEAGSPFEPEHILLLTQPAPGSKQRDSARYGDGAVLAFVSMKGGTVGDRPTAADPTWRYLLDPSPDGHSAMLVLSQKFVYQNLLFPAFIGEMTDGKNSLRGSLEAGFVELRPWLRLVGASGTYDCKWDLSAEDTGRLALAAVALMQLRTFYIGRVYNDPLHLDSASIVFRIEGAISWLVEGDIGTGETTLSMQTWLSPIVNETGSVSFSFVSGGWMRTDHLDVEKCFGSNENPAVILGSAVFKGLEERLLTVDTARLSNIVLAGERPVHLKGAVLTGDLVMYGNVSSERTGLALNRQEVIVGAGNTFQFSTNASDDIQWAVELVDGEAANEGTISSSGLYTAPELTSRWARVRLTATRANQATQALITVVREQAVVSPAIQIAVAGASAKYFVRGGAAGDWEWDTTGLKGTLQQPVPEPGDEFEPGDMQYVPPASIDTDFIIEDIKIKVGSNITTSKVVVIKGNIVTVMAEVAPDGNSATLTANMAGSPLPVPPVFTKIAGGGTLTDNVVTSEGPNTEPYIVVQAAVELAPGFSFSGYLLLPLPLSVLEGTQSQAVLQDPTLSFTF
ncbi:hypothetical protein [Pseudomonas sp. RIT-PI-S]|uniref:hypothetical protein n=1 Tax=Pseudomonas sp. RIT-PI-S TaxID=3035295 RepID=UPI0021D96130|nr:hypothetical protein [Pseudomonas sp. RIT-PI-S]